MQRCHLQVPGHDPLIDYEVRAALAQLEGAARRLRRVCEWADCETEPSDYQIDVWLQEMSTKLRDAVKVVDGLALT